MTYVLETDRLSKRYGSHWALQSINLKLPTGCIAGLVGPNGAGKTTLMKLAVGLLAPTAGSIRVFGADPWEQPLKVVPQVGYVAQERPLYHSFTVRDMLTFGKKLNREWDETLALSRLKQLQIPLERPTGKLSTGQQAQVALVLALAKKPGLLILDEPIGSLDPLARREFLQVLLDSASASGQTVLLSSHQVSDLERVCDYLVIISSSQLLVSEDIEQLRAAHCWVACRSADEELVKSHPRVRKVIESHRANRMSQLMVRTDGVLEEPGWEIAAASLDDIVLGYLAFKPEQIELEKTQ